MSGEIPLLDFSTQLAAIRSRRAAAVSEGFCPWCASRLDAQRTCRDGSHQAVRWCKCGGMVFPDVPTVTGILLCSDCLSVIA